MVCATSLRNEYYSTDSPGSSYIAKAILALNSLQRSFVTDSGAFCIKTGYSPSAPVDLQGLELSIVCQCFLLCYVLCIQCLCVLCFMLKLSTYDKPKWSYLYTHFSKPSEDMFFNPTHLVGSPHH